VGGAPGRKNGCRKRRPDQHDRGASERCGIEHRDAHKEESDGVGGRHSQDEPHDHACQREPRGLAEDEPHHVRGPRAHRQPNTDLVTPAVPG